MEASHHVFGGAAPPQRLQAERALRAVNEALIVPSRLLKSEKAASRGRDMERC